MTLEELKALSGVECTPEIMAKQRQMTDDNQFAINVDRENKVDQDVLMTALCRAIPEGIIEAKSLNAMIYKLWKSSTNSINQDKLEKIINHIREFQPNFVCRVNLNQLANGERRVYQEWMFTGPVVKFNGMYEDIVERFGITAQMIRADMPKTLQQTNGKNIVNNTAHDVTRYHPDKILSIKFITRLVNMCGYVLHAEFLNLKGETK
jgi:hypothetical protein